MHATTISSNSNKKESTALQMTQISLVFCDDRLTFNTASSQKDGSHKYTALWQLLSVSHLSVTIQQSQEKTEGLSCWLCSCYNLKLISLNGGKNNTVGAGSWR